ncbi:MAG: TIGR00153 family protein [Desulfobacterales bacterium]|nr:TIGR00153 family protein [Desulfobacterales bacterium]MDD4072246.1 TIGR00153 family protein [Desulfobacterales bacterium]MDD4392975.1 TIGR00153 family protein [Desulfobacterales bacterium]
MRIPFLSNLIGSPFDSLQEHAEKVKECTWFFQQAIECYVTGKHERFEDLRQKIIEIEREADSIKRKIHGRLPKGTFLPLEKLEFFRYLREQDDVLDAVEDAIDWISMKSDSGIPEELREDFLLLVDTVIDPIEELSNLVAEARKYFNRCSAKQREIVMAVIRTLHKQEQETDKVEGRIKRRAFKMNTDPLTVFHIIRMAEIIGSIADHAENAADMIRAMVSK